MCSPARSSDLPDSTADRMEGLTAFWGLGCIGGNTYSQVVQRRFCVTKAVLDPSSYTEDEENPIVRVNVIHEDKKFLLCVLKHEEIYQESLNLIFDRGQKIGFLIEGCGKVFLSGYEVKDPAGAVPWADSTRDSFEKGVSCSASQKSIPIESSKSKKAAETPKRDAKTGAAKKVSSDDKKVSPKPYINLLLNGEINEEDESEEEDDEFSAEFDESEEEESSEVETPSEVDEEELEEEVQVLEEDIKQFDEDGEEDEEITIPEPVPQKRKRQMQADMQQKQAVKRTKKESKTSVDSDVIICEDNSENSEDSEPEQRAATSAAASPISKSIPVDHSTEKKKKKKKKKKSETEEVVIKSPNSSSSKSATKKFQGGIETQDLVVGKGPEAVNGKLVHIFYIVRLENKQIIDARTPGKKPFSFRLGSNDVMKGLSIGMAGMKVGGKRRITIPPGVGHSAAAKGIPANKTLEYTVELQAVS